MLISKQTLVQIYFALRHFLFQFRKNFIRLFVSNNVINVNLDTDHKKLLKHISKYGWGLIPHKYLLEDSDKLEPLISRADELLHHQEEMKELAGKMTTPKKSGDYKKNFKVIITDLFDKEEILNILTDTNMIKIVGDYLGTEPYLSHADVWWDRYIDGGLKDSQTYHFDGGDPFMVKLFFYLTDVSEVDGPFTYIGKTNKLVNKFGLIYKHGVSGISDSDISSNTLLNVKKFVGKPSNVIFADTNGLHRGGAYMSNNSLGRILLTFTFVSRWPHIKGRPPNQFLPFISGTELLSGSYRNYL